MALSKPLDADKLYWACYDGEFGTVKAHDALGGSLNLKAGGSGNTALIGAVMGGHMDLLAWLVRAPGIEIDAQDNDGCTALHYAVNYDKVDYVPVLLEAGADGHIKDKSGRTAFEAWAVKTLDGFNLYYYCHAGKFGTVKAHGALGGDLNLRDDDKYNGGTGLMGAVHGGHMDLLDWLVRAPGIEIDAQNKHGWTALHYAAFFGKADCVPVLLEAGADGHIKDKRGKTALELAQAKNKSEVVGLLQQHATATPTPQPEPQPQPGAAAAGGGSGGGGGEATSEEATRAVAEAEATREEATCEEA